MNELLSLNEEQNGPVLDTEGAVLVLAGAGSGKTRVLTARIAYLIEEKRVLPQNILAITFTNKAANEMRERLNAMTDAEQMWVCTIHSMCVKILRMFPEKRVGGVLLCAVCDRASRAFGVRVYAGAGHSFLGRVCLSDRSAELGVYDGVYQKSERILPL